MRRPQRLIAATVAVALCSVLAGCGGGGMSSFDPSDLLDFLDTKKKLPGERKPVFPDGVPGLQQGVPKELYKGSRQEQIDQQNAAAAAAAAPPPEEPKSKSRGKAADRPRRLPAPRRRVNLRRQPILTPRRQPTRKALPLPCRRRRSRKRSCASAPPLRRPTSRLSNLAVGCARAVHPTIRRAVPGADAERQFFALDSVLHSIDTPFEKGAWIVHALHDCHYRPA